MSLIIYFRIFVIVRILISSKKKNFSAQNCIELSEMLRAHLAIWNRDYISGPYMSPNSTLHIKRSSMPPRGLDISSMPPRIDSAGTSLMNSMPWHMPMIGRRLIPRISISMRICTLPYSLMFISHIYTRIHVHSSLMRIVKHFDFVRFVAGIWHLVSSVRAIFAVGSSHHRLSETKGNLDVDVEPFKTFTT